MVSITPSEVTQDLPEAGNNVPSKEPACFRHDLEEERGCPKGETSSARELTEGEAGALKKTPV